MLEYEIAAIYYFVTGIITAQPHSPGTHRISTPLGFSQCPSFTKDAYSTLVPTSICRPPSWAIKTFLNDKIIDLGSGISYYAEIPRNVRDHHIIVQIQRKGKVKGAI